MTKTLITLLSASALVAFPVGALARPAPVSDHVDLGPNGKGDACVADRTWSDPGVTDPFAVSLTMTCRGTTAGRHLAVARRVRADQAADFDKLLDCGAAREFTVPGVGTVQGRRCFDTVLGLGTIETRIARGGVVISVSAVGVAEAPAEQMLRLLAGAPLLAAEAGRAARPVVDVAALAAPAGKAGVAEASTPASDSLDQGLRFIRAGLFGEASRVLSEALGRIDSSTPVETRLELLLLAGLADSDLSYFDSAEARFKQAEALLQANGSVSGAAILDRKRLAYVALDLLNRQDFDNALGSLNRLTRSTDNAHPLLDPAVLVELNQSPKRGGRGVDRLVTAPDADTLSQLVIDAQANWARSIVLLAQAKPAEALKVLGGADVDIALLASEKISQQQILWLLARVERQRARLMLATGNPQGALAAIDRAIGALRRAQLNGEIGPVLAEAEFERAAIIARDPSGKDAALAQFGTAVDELVAANVQGLVPPASVADYLDLLIADNHANPKGTAVDRFFRATQVIADPAIARQFVELQSLVAASPALASKKQDEQDLEREISRLRYEAAEAQATDPKKARDLRDQGDRLETEQLFPLQGELQRDPSYGAVSDSAASIADVQKVLQPGEVFFKLTAVRDSLFGILIDHDGPVIYRVAQPERVVEKVVARLRESIDGGGAKLNVFDVAAANAVFQLVTGPVSARLMAGQSLIVDAGGPLQRIPIGVLVPDKASVAAYAASRKKALYDYSAVDFLARHMPVSVALSPRSLIVARGLAASAAPMPFMGFAQHAPVPLTTQVADGLVSVGSNCKAERKAIAALTRALQPISAKELDRAGSALGLARVPSLTGAAFTDIAVETMTDLNQFQVLHFATHGLTEGQWGCSTSPPGLVTSMDGPQSAAILSFEKIARLKLDANLVVLSACDTAAGVSIGLARATGQEEAGASLEGLVRAFLAANARAVLSTYWPISDAGESEDLMADFYHSARNGTIGDALRSAQVAILSKPASSHPFFWGAFFIVGDSHKPLVSGAARTQLHLQTADAARP